MLDTQNEINPFSLFENLFLQKGIRYIEWSLTVKEGAVLPRNKPTFYIYPNDNGYSNYFELNKVLHEIVCPGELLNIQRDSMLSSLYQGIRVPLSQVDYKCLYIHDEKREGLRAYRWKNKNAFDEVLYDFHFPSIASEAEKYIHPTLKLPYSLMINNELFSHTGIWFQKIKNTVNEVYLSYPERPELKGVLKNLKNYFSITTLEKINLWSNVRFRNIGFDCINCDGQPGITIYFSIPVYDKLPGNYNELVGMTHQFFNGSKELFLP